MSGSILTVLDADTLRALFADELDRRLAPVLAALVEGRRPAKETGEAGSMLTRSELARRLGVNTRTVRRMVLAGDLPEPVKMGRRTVRWNREDIEVFLSMSGGPR